MISSIRRQNPQLQLLLFSATFNEDVKRFAQKVVGPDANQVSLTCSAARIEKRMLSMQEQLGATGVWSCHGWGGTREGSGIIMALPGLCMRRCMCHGKSFPWMSSSSTGWCAAPLVQTAVANNILVRAAPTLAPCSRSDVIIPACVPRARSPHDIVHPSRHVCLF